MGQGRLEGCPPGGHGREVWPPPSRPNLGHVDGTSRQRFVAQDRPVLVPLSSLQHDLKLVAFSFQEVGVLREKEGGSQQ